jgi:hypothetical protein
LLPALPFLNIDGIGWEIINPGSHQMDANNILLYSQHHHPLSIHGSF